jgi:hypothetical protein
MAWLYAVDTVQGGSGPISRTRTMFASTAGYFVPFSVVDERDLLLCRGAVAYSTRRPLSDHPRSTTFGPRPRFRERFARHLGIEGREAAVVLLIHIRCGNASDNP